MSSWFGCLASHFLAHSADFLYSFSWKYICATALVRSSTCSGGTRPEFSMRSNTGAACAVLLLLDQDVAEELIDLIILGRRSLSQLPAPS